MTFRSSKFSDSETMRNLERLAISKGLITPERPMQKQASSENAEPKTFAEKLLSLCSGLRDKGLFSYADELEQKFLIYKKASADSLYDVFKETGEDLIDFAHPGGGNKLDKHWSDLGTVETKVEQHQKILSVIQKQPKGKLASKNIINAVKIALASGGDADDDFLGDSKTSLGQQSNLPAEIGAGVATTTLVGVPLIKWMVNNAKFRASDTGKYMADWLKDNPDATKEEANAVLKLFRQRNTVESMNRWFGQGGAKAVQEGTKDVLQGGAREIELDLGKGAATDVAETAAPVAEGSSVIADLLAGGAIAAGSVIAATIGSALAGGTIGWLESAKFYETDLQKSGQNMIEALDDVEGDLHGNAAGYSRAFRSSFKQVMELLPKTQSSDPGKMQETLTAASQMDSQIGILLHATNNLMGYADKEKTWGERLSHPTGWSNLRILSQNFSDLLVKLNDSLNELFNKVREIANQNRQKGDANGVPANVLLQKMNAENGSAANINQTLTDIANKPSVKNDPQKSQGVAAIVRALGTYLDDLDKMRSILSTLGSRPVEPENFAELTRGTKMFAGVNSEASLKQRAQSFYSQIAKKVQFMQGW